MNPRRLAAIPVVFYRTPGGAEPVLEWLRKLPAEDRRAIGTDLATVQFGWPIGMPLCRPLGDGLWELRSRLPSRRIARLLFFVHDSRIRPGARLHQEDAEDAGERSGFGPAAHDGDADMSGKNPHWGTTLDAFLTEEGIREAAKAEAVTRVVAWQLGKEMERQGITKAQLAERMHTSRAQVDRILKAKGNVTVESLQRAAALVGRELRLELV